jgi:hypothetical protein
VAPCRHVVLRDVLKTHGGSSSVCEVCRRVVKTSHLESCSSLMCVLHAISTNQRNRLNFGALKCSDYLGMA